jgi:hypothetical protein
MNTILIPWVIASTLLLFVAAYWVYTLEKRVDDLEGRCETLIQLSEMAPDPSDEQGMLTLLQRLDDQGDRLDRIEPTVRRFGAALPHVVQGLGVVRYNAFDGVGGDQSFSVALIDTKGNGVVLSGLHTGDEVRVYAKPLHNWKATHSLSADEQRALGEARQRMEGIPGNG